MVLLILHFLHHQALNLLKDLAILSLLDLHDIHDILGVTCKWNHFFLLVLQVLLVQDLLVVPLCHILSVKALQVGSGSLSLPVTPSRPQPFGDSQHIDVSVHVINNLL